MLKELTARCTGGIQPLIKQRKVRTSSFGWNVWSGWMMK